MGVHVCTYVMCVILQCMHVPADIHLTLLVTQGYVEVCIQVCPATSTRGGLMDQYTIVPTTTCPLLVPVC